MSEFDTKSYLEKLDAWWRAANYISAAQMYLKDNPLLRRELVENDLKVHPIGHWGTVPGQNFIYAHLNRAINKYDLDMFYIEGPGHGGQVMVSNSYLDGSYTELNPNIEQTEDGFKQLCKIFSFPCGIASHAAPETPGSIHEGGELGYALSHATGAILDNPDVIAATVIGDGEGETGPLMAGWLSNTFINPVNDGAVLPIFYLNGGKIHNPTIFERKTDEELSQFFEGLGWKPIFADVVELSEDHAAAHALFAEKLDQAIQEIKTIQSEARQKPAEEAIQAKFPVLVARIPKGWTGPKAWEGTPIEGGFRAHQVPIPVDAHHMEHVDSLLSWLQSYRPEELFDENGKIVDEIAAISPKGDRRMSMNPITNAGIVKAMDTADWKKFALDINVPGQIMAQDMIEFGKYAADLVDANPDNFRIFGPDETKSNRLQEVFTRTSRQWLGRRKPDYDEALSPAGRVIDSQLSEHQAEGFLEGYVLTGRHGFFASYESFLRVVDSMVTQHFKWLRKSKTHTTWRKNYPALNLIAASTVFQQDHNGYTHQDPGILTHLAEKTPEYIREYLPADTNSLLAVMDKAFKAEDKINLIVTSKHPRPQFYSIAEAEELVAEGYKVIDWASNVSLNQEPDVVFAAAGTEPNLEALAAISILHKAFPELKIRFVNVLDILKLRHPSQDARGLSDEEFNKVFTTDKPVIFAFHGYEDMIRDIFFSRHNHNLHTHGYRENGDITTPFDMRVMSELDRFHLAQDAALASLGNKAQAFSDEMNQMVAYHKDYIREHGDDIPEVQNWKWENIK
ncbi:TPA: phosphoketolase [Streptococcus agalactiae]|uniref:Xylulose-5-phosphate/fructose-6-phosphate phosphoketolase n=6 Tax=Streptococcus agalactiae TaxID=1311 RepID=Q8DXQ1_STRA5|nr:MULTISPECIES: phosphoketolase family protein [Streptococcus]EAO62302.1 D-xylulose 5-phosphate/D-fructose 6-phosphate phosphoketolase [Streptococcus agalactiae 18RS21]HEO8209150.1 phosphoketolase family protein [Streptococcus agalactiae ADL-350]AAN00662.1 xylulose-5-phosphate/fructose-6-phosphate phosphoketolase [Streptococcus agalactiae 2603V/R]AKU04304.1 phosphoketolase [Streptococcus agalactiae]ASA90810.1 phosphoketolase [Streptococcus agalactiae]